MKVIDSRAPCLSVSAACRELDFPRATYYRMHQTRKPWAARPSPRALSPSERQEVLDVLHEPRFVDFPPGQVYARLIDEGRYIASERTMYRILAANNEVKERRRQRKHPKYQKPELLATKPNELWSWDITRLRGPNKLEYYQLYVIIDVYSRYTVGWLIAHVESSKLAKHLIGESCKEQGVSPEQLTIHSDRGPSMKSKTVADLLAHLGVIKSHSRPRVSNDNPYSESQFKTMKYCPTYPDRFGSIEDATAFCRDFFSWYNHEHYHSGLNMLTPHDVHTGKAAKRLTARAAILAQAYQRHKERFVRGKPTPKELVREVWINKPVDRSQKHLFVCKEKPGNLAYDSEQHKKEDRHVRVEKHLK